MVRRRTARFPAIGRIAGDWGGGWGLAEEALWHAADGRGEATTLVHAARPLRLSSMDALLEVPHLEHIAHERRGEPAPVLLATAADGEPVARAIVDRLVEEVTVMATVALTRLDLLDEPAPVLLGGSVLTAGLPRLDDGIRALLGPTRPRSGSGSSPRARCSARPCWVWTGFPPTLRR